MKNLKLLYILALGLLLTLGACEKDSKSSGVDPSTPEEKNDPSTPEGKIEMSIAALGTNGEKLIDKLEQKGWDGHRESSKEYDEYFIYTKGDNEMCEILLAYDGVYVVSWINRYKSFSDAVTAYCDYHDTAESKAKDEYDGQVYGSREEFVKPSELKNTS